MDAVTPAQIDSAPSVGPMRSSEVHRRRQGAVRNTSDESCALLGETGDPPVARDTRLMTGAEKTRLSG
jgi:hypothetical protein